MLKPEEKLVSQPRTVVLIDESTAMREMIEYCAASLDFDLKVYQSANAAMADLKQSKPDLLLLDIILPDTDGLTFLQELRAHPLHEETPVVIMTAKDYDQDRSLAKELGVLEFVTKPMCIKTIRGVISGHLGGS